MGECKKGGWRVETFWSVDIWHSNSIVSLTDECSDVLFEEGESFTIWGGNVIRSLVEMTAGDVEVLLLVRGRWCGNEIAEGWLKEEVKIPFCDEEIVEDLKASWNEVWGENETGLSAGLEERMSGVSSLNDRVSEKRDVGCTHALEVLWNPFECFVSGTCTREWKLSEYCLYKV